MRTTAACTHYRPSAAAGETVWRGLDEGGGFITPKRGQVFTFAAGSEATIKADAERARSQRPDLFEPIVGLFVAHPCVQAADALSFVPNGMKDFAEAVAAATKKPLINLVRPEGAERSAIEFVSRADKILARRAMKVCLLEDIVTTGSSIGWSADVLWRENPHLIVHSLAMLYRGSAEPVIPNVPHSAFLWRCIPTDIESFRVRFPRVRVDVVDLRR